MRKKMAKSGLVVAAILFLSTPAMAQELGSSGVMNDVLDRFHEAASTWGPAIEAAATYLFWSLAVISMVWTFGLMALRKADIGEFFAEFVKFTLFTGFFWWLLSNATTGMNIAGTMVSSLQALGAQAGGLPDDKLGPSTILDLGFELYNKTVQATAQLGWRQLATALVMELLAISILIVLALIAINLLLVLASAWIILYAGIFFLGFGGSRWTSDIAINYYRTVLGVAAQLLSMVLLVAIGRQFLQHYYLQISEGVSSQELAVMLVIALILLFLVNKVPSMLSGIVTGASVGAVGAAGSFGAGAAMGAAMTAANIASGGSAMVGGAIASGAVGAAGGAQALMAAFSKASAATEGGGGDMPGSDFAGSFSSGSDSDSGGNSPLAAAMGLDSGSSGSSGGFGGDSTGGGSKSGLQKAGAIAVGTVSNLAQGSLDTAKTKASQMYGSAMDRVGETTGGKIATAIRSSALEDTAMNEDHSVSGNRRAEANAEVAAFVNRDRGGQNPKEG